MTDRRRYEGLTLEAGQELAVRAVLDTETNPGRKTRRLIFETAGGETFRATIRLEVYGTWTLRPEVLDFAEVLVDETAEPVARLVTFESTQDGFLGVRDLTVPWLEYRVAERGAGKTEILVRVLPARLPPGLSSTSLVVDTTNDIKPAAAVYVRAKGLQPVVPVPEHVFLIGAQAQLVMFHDEGGQPVRLASCAVDNPVIELEITAHGQLRVANADPSEKVSAAVRVVDERGKKGTVFVSTF